MLTDTTPVAEEADPNEWTKNQKAIDASRAEHQEAIDAANELAANATQHDKFLVSTVVVDKDGKLQCKMQGGTFELADMPKVPGLVQEALSNMIARQNVPEKPKEEETIKHRWGSSKYLYRDSNIALAYARGKGDGASSLHTHAHKSNAYVGIYGSVSIETHDETGLISYQRLHAGDTCLVPSGVPHRMHFLADTELYELYMADQGENISLADIDRTEDGWTPEDGELVMPTNGDVFPCATIKNVTSDANGAPRE